MGIDDDITAAAAEARRLREQITAAHTELCKLLVPLVSSWTNEAVKRHVVSGNPAGAKALGQPGMARLKQDLSDQLERLPGTIPAAFEAESCEPPAEDQIFNNPYAPRSDSFSKALGRLTHVAGGVLGRAGLIPDDVLTYRSEWQTKLESQGGMGRWTPSGAYYSNQAIALDAPTQAKRSEVAGLVDRYKAQQALLVDLRRRKREDEAENLWDST